MHGQRVSHSEGPLYHPSGACDLKPIWKEDSGIKNKDPAFYENQRDQHFWKQNQLAKYNAEMPRGAKLKFYSQLPSDAISTMPGKEAMRAVRYNALGKPGAIKPKASHVTHRAKESGKLQITKVNEFTIKTDIPKTKEDLQPFDVYGNQLGRNNNITFTEAEKYATERYKSSSYIEINSHLRGTSAKHAYVPVEGDIDDIIKNLDSAIDKSVLPRDVNVYRGISPNTAKKLMNDNTCVDLGYTSTTYDPNTALQFVGEGGSRSFSNVMVFKHKKGTKALMWEHEEEVLSARGLKLKCTEIKEVKKVKGMLRSNEDIVIDNVRFFIMEAP